MKKHFVIAFLSAAILLTGCNKTSESAKGGNTAAASEGKDVAQHCLDKDQTLCFLQVEDGGKSHFYTTNANYDKLLLNAALASANIPLEKLEAPAYEKMVVDTLAPNVVYTNKVDVYPNPKDDSANLRFNFLQKKSFFKRHGKKLGIGGLILLLLGGGSTEANSRSVPATFHFGPDALEGAVQAD